MSAGSSAPLELAILISGRGSNMVAIARACLTGQINARVRVVISDRPGVAGLAAARDLGIEALTVPWPGADDMTTCTRALIWPVRQARAMATMLDPRPEIRMARSNGARLPALIR